MAAFILQFGVVVTGYFVSESQNLASSFMFTSADLLTTIKLFLDEVKEDVTMCDRNTDHGNVMLQLEFLAQNRNVLYEETDVYV